MIIFIFIKSQETDIIFLPFVFRTVGERNNPTGKDGFNVFLFLCLSLTQTALIYHFRQQIKLNYKLKHQKRF
jgi:hypothetical protein